MNRALALLLLFPAISLGQFLTPESEPEPVEPRSLEQLAMAADLVALVQVADTDYAFTRGFPSGGTAFLKVLIPYKVTRPLEEFLEVYEEGLHEFECYFPTVDVDEVGRRFLVFLTFSTDVEEQYNGLPQGCALEVLVTRENLYALRFPFQGMALNQDYSNWAAPTVFADENALILDENITPDLRNAWLEAGWLTREEPPPDDGFDPLSGPATTEAEIRYRFTHGIDLTTLRKQLGPEALTLDRTLK